MSTIFVTSNSEFYNTYKLYREYIGYKHDYSYRQWLRLPERFKAAALYVQFYNEITLAWYKVKTEWSFEEEGVECINQYLLKNVEKIIADKKRFTPQYIYKVAYNCLYCLCIDPTKNKMRYQSETPSSFNVGDDELDWFDYLGEVFDFEEQSIQQSLRNFFDSLDTNLDLYVQYKLGELTEYKLCCKLKAGNYITCNVRDAQSRKQVIDYVDSEYPILIQTQFESHPEFIDLYFQYKGLDF